MAFPFEVGFDEIQTRIEEFVDTTFNSLKSEFLSMPRATGFLAFETFDAAYEALKRCTATFETMEAGTVPRVRRCDTRRPRCPAGNAGIHAS
jgi:hypothetical protein